MLPLNCVIKDVPVLLPGLELTNKSTDRVSFTWLLVLLSVPALETQNTSSHHISLWPLWVHTASALLRTCTTQHCWDTTGVCGGALLPVKQPLRCNKTLAESRDSTVTFRIDTTTPSAMTCIYSQMAPGGGANLKFLKKNIEMPIIASNQR